MDADAIRKFWSKVDKSGGADACWPWMGRRDRDGYGQFYVDGVDDRANRLALRIDRGIPEGLWALHTCDNPPCCNPAHLYAGDVLQNTRDKYARGRAAPKPAGLVAHLHGDANPMRRPEVRALISGDRSAMRRHPEIVRRGSASNLARLTEANVLDIRNAIAAGVRRDHLAEQYGVTSAGIRAIAIGRTWAHVGGPIVPIRRRA